MEDYLKPDLYFSVDIEADGPNPGDNSMVSLGAAAFERGNRKPISTFEVNLDALPCASTDPKTMEWWNTVVPSEVRDHVFSNRVEAGAAMNQFAEWVSPFRKNWDPVLLVYPTWDAMWVTWYFNHFQVKHPFGLGALDMKSFGFSKYADSWGGFKSISKKNLPKYLWEGAGKHTHRALDDALEQGVMFINMLE